MTLPGGYDILDHMVEDPAGTSLRMDAVFHALAHDARRDMLRRLERTFATLASYAVSSERSPAR